MPAGNGRLFGCNVIDPLLQVRGGTDYSPEITRRSLQFLRDIGHDAIEYSHACHWSPQECEQIRRIADEVGLIPWSLHAWAGWDIRTPEGRESIAGMLRLAMRNAQALSVGIIVHHPHGQRHDPELLRTEAELLGGLTRPGVRLALENMSTLASMEYAVALADALGPDKAGLCVDTGHAGLGDLGPGRAIRMAASRLITTHLQDNLGQRDDHLPPGDGRIDWEDVAAALNEVQYAGCLMLELTDQPNTEERRVAIREELRRGAEAARRIAGRLAGNQGRSAGV